MVYISLISFRLLVLLLVVLPLGALMSLRGWHSVPVVLVQTTPLPERELRYGMSPLTKRFWRLIEPLLRFN